MKKVAVDAEIEFCQLRDGRRLCYRLYGKKSGQPVYFLHGFPGCRIQAEMLHDQAIMAGICLIGFDRAGFGKSEYDPKRTMSSSSLDLIDLANYLNHESFSVIGVSCGGAYALSCAHEFPERITRVILLSGMGPMDKPEIRKTQLGILTLMFSLARKNQFLISPLLALDWLMFRNSPDKAVKIISKMLTKSDQAFLESNKKCAEIFGQSLAEAYSQGIVGAMREAKIIGERRPYDLGKIEQPVYVYQPVDDRHVPLEMGKYIAANVKRGKLRILDNEGHLSVVVNGFSAYLAEQNDDSNCESSN